MNTRIRGSLELLVLSAAAAGDLRPEQAKSSPPAKAAPKSAPATQQAAAKPAAPETKYKRLILKDGSYELVSAYEIKGDRLRYLSSERHEWEEIPNAMVDWAATEKYAREAGAENSARATKLGESAVRERAEEEDLTPLASPGIRLPARGGVFLLDKFQGSAELVTLPQNGADINKNMGGNILRAVINPVATAKHTIELKGPHAKIQSHVGEPAIFISLDSDDPANDYTPATARDHFRIVRCEDKKGNRVVGAVNIAVYGKVEGKADYVVTRVEPVSGRWVKVTPATTLPPGEYALVEVLGKGINTFVWDFGVNPSAPANYDAFKPDPASDKPPELIQRKRP
jgi:hypothetical protein